jgi:type II secretory pathway pseudopilin PulG
VKVLNHTKQSRRGFTIIELLTIMSIIVILIGLLVPGLNKVRRYARKVKQKSQFHGIKNGIELFNAEQDGYPESYDNNVKDSSDPSYCGAMKLAEAMVGKDMIGYNPKSNFVGEETEYYLPNDTTGENDDTQNIDGRIQYLELEGINANYMGDLYGSASDCAPYDPCEVVLCDVYGHQAANGERTGMPILYYKANTSGTAHPNPTDGTLSPGSSSSEGYLYEGNIYDYSDNYDLAAVSPYHSNIPTTPVNLTNEQNCAEEFYKATWNKKVNIPGGRPYRSDSFILQSAGFDGIYFTGDDVYNFNTGE